MEAGRIVQALAVLGLPLMSADELAEAAGMPTNEARTAMAALIDTGWLTLQLPGWYALAGVDQLSITDPGDPQEIRRRFGEYVLRCTRAARNRNSDAPRTPLAANPLSRREREVLGLIADGLGNRSTARILFVSVETVRTHVKSIMRKLGANDRTHAVATALRTGLIT